jgi:UDP-N-acetylmuramyl pentapeptide synthase
MGKLRFLFALWMAKLSIPALKVTHHNGTDFPGSLAVKLCPDFLRYVGKPKTIVAVTGTNGKTTVSNMLADVLEARGHKVMSNRAGSNIISGISTAFIRNCTLLGRVNKCDIAVLEVDERSSPRIYPYVKPDYVVITNLFRDSIMRNAHPYFIADVLTRSIPRSSKMVLNADDLISSSVSPENERVYFGIDRLKSDVTECINLIDDVRICPRCSTRLEYAYRRYHHIGKARCPHCGFSSPESDYLATGVDFDTMTMTIREDGQDHPYRLITDSIFNVYNMVTVAAVLRQLGYDHTEIAGELGRAAVAKSRHSEEQVGQVRLIRQMSKEKNALAGSRAFDYIAGRSGRKELLLMMNCLGDMRHWSENTCWIFDADFEFLNHESIVQLVCTGARCRDYKLRLLMAGVPEERIICEEDEFRAAERLAYAPGDDIYLLYGTDSLALAYQVYDHMKELAQQHAADKEVRA